MSSVTLVSHIPHQRVAIRPAEIILNGFIIQTSPLVFLVVVWWGQKDITFSRQVNHSLIWDKPWGSEPTVDVTLLLRGHDGHQVSSQHATVLLRNLPAQTLAEVSVAETVELIPTWLTLLHVWKHHRGDRTTKSLGCLNRFSTVCCVNVWIPYWLETATSFPTWQTWLKQFPLQNSKRAHRSDRSFLRMLANRDIEPARLAQCKCLHWDRGRPNRHLKQNRAPVQNYMRAQATVCVYYY